MFDAAEFCETVKAAVGAGRISSSLALRDGAAAVAAVKCLQDFANRAEARIGPDVVAAYVSYSPAAVELFTALRAISINLELVSTALECLTCVVRYSLDASRPQQALEQARSVVKEIVKSRAVLIYDILANDGRACAKKALNLLRLVATCHPMLVKELVNRFDLSAKSMAPSLCSITNNHCRVPFLDLMFVILASGERDVLHYLSGKGREVIVTCLRTIQERTSLEAKGGTESSKKSILWRQGKAHQNQKAKILPSHVQKRELVAAINFLLAIEKHLFKASTKSSRGAFAHPVPTLLASLAALDCPPLDVAPREVQPEHKALRSNASRIFLSIVRDTSLSAPDDIVRALNNPSFDFGTESVVSFVCGVIRERPDLAAPLLQNGRILSSPPALTLRWFGHFSVIAFCTLHLQKLITSFKDKQYFEKCLGHSDPLIRHLGCTIVLSFCKIVGRFLNSEHQASDYLPTLEAIQKTAKPGAKDVNLVPKMLASYQSLFQKHDDPGVEVKLMMASVDAAGEDTIAAARTIEAALRTSPYSAVRKIVRKGYLSKLIVKASQVSRPRDALKLWRVCGMVLQSTDLFQPGTEDEVDVYLSVLSSLGKDAEPSAKAFEAMIAQALDMPYGLYDRLHSEEWSDESAAIKTSHLSVATVIKLQKLEQNRSSTDLSSDSNLIHRTLQRMVLSVVAMSSVLLHHEEPKSYLTMILPSFMKAEDIYWRRTGNATEDTKGTSREIIQGLLRSRGTYPTTKFLRLVGDLAAFDRKIHSHSRRLHNIQMNSNLGIAWNSWCDYGLLHYNGSSHGEWTEQSKLEQSSDEQGSIVFKGLLRILLQVAYPGRIQVKPVEDLRILREAFTSNDYRFVTGMMLRTVGNAKTRGQLFEEALAQMSDEQRCHKLHPEEAEFLYETVVRAIASSSTLAASEVNIIASICFSMMSKWDTVTKSELHVAYSIAVMKTLLTHSSADISLRFKVFLASKTVDKLPPVVELTTTTTKSFLMLLKHSSSFRKLAFAQVYRWTEKDFRHCKGIMLGLVNDAIGSVKGENVAGVCHEELLQRFLKASLKSKSPWVSSDVNEDDIGNFHALESLACMVARSRKLSKLFLHRLIDKGFVSTNSWILLRLVIDPLKGSSATAEITIQEYAKLFSFLLNHMHSAFKSTEYPDVACVQVLNSVIRRLRVKRFSFLGVSASANEDLELLCRNMTKCVQSRFAMNVSNSELAPTSVASQNLGHLQYIASILASQAEVFKIDLSLENAARETLLSIFLNECQFLKYCLQTDHVKTRGSDIFQDTTDVVIAFMSVIKSAIPWLSRTNCDDDLGRSLLSAHMLLSSQLHEVARGRNERHLSVRECFRALTNYISACNLEQRATSITNQSLFPKTEAATNASGFQRFMLEEAAEYVFKRSYHLKCSHDSPPADTRHTLDPIFALNTFLRGCRQALVQPHTPVLDLQRVTRDGLFALSVTGIASPDPEIRILSFACLEAFAAVVGPVAGVPVGSASALYKDRRQLAFLLDLLRNSISDPMTPVLPLFAVWFKSATRIVLTPSHAANKLVSNHLLRVPCLDVFDCYGLSYYLNCEAGRPELKAVRELAFDIVQKGVRTEKDVAVIRKKRVFDKIFMLSTSTMGFDEKIRVAALRSLEAIINRDDSLNIVEELVSGHGVATWVSGGSEYVAETIEEALLKLNIIQGIAKSYTRRKRQAYDTVLAEALNLFITSRLKTSLTNDKGALLTKRIAECGAQIARISSRRRHLFRIDFARLWIESGSKSQLSRDAKRDFVYCVCKQQNRTAQPEVLEMLLEYVMHKDPCGGEVPSEGESNDVDSSIIEMFVAECLLALDSGTNLADAITPGFCKLLGATLYHRSSIWLLTAGVRTLHLTRHLNEKIIGCTQKIPAFIPRDVDLSLEMRCHSTVKDTKLIIIEELLNLGNAVIPAHSKPEVIKDKVTVLEGGT